VRVCIVGCGAVGSLFAANLANLDDVEVWAYDLSREHVDAINAGGLRLSGAGEEGLGEDVTYEASEHDLVQAQGPIHPLAGEWTVATFSDQLATFALFDHEPRAALLDGEHGFDHRLVVGVGLHREHEMVRRVAHVDAARAFPRAREGRLDDAAEPQLAFDGRDPPGEPLRVGDRRPEVGDFRVVDILHANRGTLFVDAAHAPQDPIHVVLPFPRFPRAISVCSASSRSTQTAR